MRMPGLKARPTDTERPGLKTRPTDALVGRYDADLELRDHVPVDPNRHRVLADRLERLVELNPPTVDGQIAERQRLADVGGGHRSVQRVVLADTARDRDLGRLDLRRQLPRFADLLGVLRLGLGALARNLPGVARGDGQRE